MKKIYLLILATIFTVNITNAESNVNNKISFDFSETVAGFVQSAKDVVGKIAPASLNKDELVQHKEDEEVVSKKYDILNLNICEVYDVTYLNTIDLDVASTKAVEKIEKIEETIDEEALLREGIFEKGADKNKKLTDLQKKERIVFREMRKEIEEAKKFYEQVNEVVADTNIFLENSDCENIDKKDEKTLRSMGVDTDELVTEEGIFRKSFSASLKDKISILQSGVKQVGGK